MSDSNEELTVFQKFLHKLGLKTGKFQILIRIYFQTEEGPVWHRVVHTGFGEDHDVQDLQAADLELVATKAAQEGVRVKKAGYTGRRRVSLSVIDVYARDKKTFLGIMVVVIKNFDGRKRFWALERIRRKRTKLWELWEREKKALATET